MEELESLWMTILGAWLCTRYAAQEVCILVASVTHLRGALTYRCLGRLQAWVSAPSPSLRPDTLPCGLGKGGRRAQKSSLCFKFPGAHVLRWLEAARGRVWDR